MQVVLRDKEDFLVEKALQRIRRAQELGKANVKLTKAELEALQRKRQKDAEQEPRSRVKERQRGNPKKPAKKEKMHERDRYQSQYEDEPSASSRRKAGVLIPTNTSFPYYPHVSRQSPSALHSPKSSRSSSRVPSSQTPPRTSPDLSRRGGEKRVTTAPSPRLPPSNASSRSLPDDPNWMPRPRSSSSLGQYQHPYPADPNYPYGYQAYSPPIPQMPAQYTTQSRRIVSNPQSDTRDRLPRYDGLGRLENSAPRPRPESSAEASENSGDDDDDDDDEGVQIDVVPASNGRGYEIMTAGDGNARGRRGGRR